MLCVACEEKTAERPPRVEIEVAAVCAACGVEFAPQLRAMFAPDEWATVELMPLWVAYGIAFADGRMDPAEAATICEQLAHPELYKCDLMHEVLQWLAGDAVQAVGRYQTDTRTLEEGLREGASIVERRLPAQALLFKESLMALADKVAEASGGFFGIGDRWSREEKEMAARMMAALGLTFDPQTRGFR